MLLFIVPSKSMINVTEGDGVMLWSKDSVHRWFLVSYEMLMTLIFEDSWPDVGRASAE